MAQKVATGDPPRSVARSHSQAFGVAIKEARTARGLSQEAAALACGVDRSYYGRVERGQKSPTLETIWRISDGLDTQPSELLARAERLIG